MKILLGILGMLVLATAAVAQEKPKVTLFRGKPLMGSSFTQVVTSLGGPEGFCKDKARAKAFGYMAAGLTEERRCHKGVEKVMAGAQMRVNLDHQTEIQYKGDRLVSIAVTVYGDGSFAGTLTEATQKYGRPDNLTSAVFQNAYGMQVTLRAASWNMPDGVVIHVVERWRIGRFTEVAFYTADEEAARNASLGHKPVL